MKQSSIVDTWLNTVAYLHSQSKATEEQYKRVWGRFGSDVGRTVDKILADYNESEGLKTPAKKDCQ
jgi:hypothetical protein